MSGSESSKGQSAQDQALAVALRLMRPYARLMVAQGLKYGEAAEVLKRAFVEIGKSEIEAAGAIGNVSRISVSTGLHRQDVKRLLDAPIESLDRGRSLAAEVYTRWLTDSKYRNKGGPRKLPVRSTDRKPSFETLARSVSTDVHPRTLIEELKRLGLVEFDESTQMLSLSPDGFVPINERAGMLGLLGDNVSDHFATAVGNVLGDQPRRLEQSVYAEGLDAESLTLIDGRAREIWRALMESMVPLLQTLVEKDRATRDSTAERVLNAKERITAKRNRVRVGMYVHAESLESAPVVRASRVRKQPRD